MRRSLQPALWLATLTVVLGLVLAACNSATGTDTTPPTLSITSSATATGTTYDLTGTATDNVAATEITYTVDGGPLQTVNLTNSNFSITVTLQSGTNTIVVHAFDAAGNETTDTFTVTVSGSGNTDSLQIGVSGLPNGVNADITVTGPNSYSDHVTAGTTLTGLSDGTYTVTAASVTSGGTVYDPAPASQTVTLSGGQTGSASVAYAAQSSGTGSLTITVVTPTGVTANIQVTGPGGYSAHVTGTTTLTGLTAGSYSIVPSTVNDGTYDYAGVASPSSVSVSANTTGSATVTYTASDGALHLTASGVPSGETGAVAVTGPNGYADSWNAPSGTTAISIIQLPPGSYSVTAADITVSSSSDVYHATITGSPASVTAGATANVGVAYARTTNHLTVTINNPSSTGANVTVTGPGISATPLNATATLTGLADGTYTITAGNIASGGVTYVPNLTSQTVTLSGGQNGSATVTYTQQQATTASLNVAISGLQNGTAASVEVTGTSATNFDQVLTAGGTLSGLQPDTYTITVHPVSGTHYSYTGTASPSSVTLAAGDSPTVNVTYTATDGALNMTVSGLPTNTAAGVQLAPYPSGSAGTTYTIDASGLIAHIAPGTYSFVINQVTGSDQELYDDTADNGATITIAAGATLSKTLAFIQVSGDLQIVINGVTTADVSVSQPGLGYTSPTITQSVTLKGLYASATGTPYYINANPVNNGSYDFSGTATSTNPVVQRGQSATVTVTYAATDGALAVTISGLPGGLAADVQVVDPTGYVAFSPLTQTGTFYYVPAGTYNVVVTSVQDSNYSYAFVPYQGNPYTFQVTVTNGNTAQAAVTYGAVTGILDVTVNGITDGATPNVTVASTSTSYPVTSSGLTALKFLGAGDYTTTASNITGSLFHYTPNPASQTVHVGQGQTVAETVDYVPSDGAMQITFSGPHPSLSSYDAAVTGPGGTSFTLTTSSANVPVTKSYLPQGSYTVTPDPYTSNSCPSGATVTRYTYTMTPTSPAVTNGQTESISVVYSTFQFQCP